MSKANGGPSMDDVRKAMRRLQCELSHPAMVAAVNAPVGQEEEAARAVLSGGDVRADGDERAVAAALVREIREHGAPNRFSPGELASRHSLPSPLALGRIGSRSGHTLTLLVRQQIPGVSIGYADRHYVVSGTH